MSVKEFILQRVMRRAPQSKKRAIALRILTAVKEELQRRGYDASVNTEADHHSDWGIDTDAPDDIKDEVTSAAIRNWNGGRGAT